MNDTNKHLNGYQQATERWSAVELTVYRVLHKSFSLFQTFQMLCMSLYIQRASSGGVPPQLECDVAVYVNSQNSNLKGSLA
jgi:hypothetical protein